MGETLKWAPPPQELLLAIGTINYDWAQLDSFISGAYVFTLGIDPIEAGITIGRLDSRAKVEKLKKIYRHSDLPQLIGPV